MLFNSLEFLIFFPLVFGCYFLSPHRIRHIILLFSSYVFYMWWNIDLVFLIAFTTLLSYGCGLGIGKSGSRKAKKAYLITGIVGSLAVLIFFKYFGFLTDAVSDVIGLFGGSADPLVLNILLPVGISFYTFQTLSYDIDIYRGEIKPEKNILYYALYVSFFPQLVAGPIERPENLLPQLKQSRTIEKENLSQGLKLMLIGFFKKIAVADIAGIYVNIVFNDIDQATGLMVAVASLLFAVQILCDFAGYSDIAMGCAKCFGIDLMRNFDKPYRSHTIREFWSRWHISLSSWFKDYLYFPLGGSRVSLIRWILNTLIVFLVSGLWHGAAYTFLLWGLLHGLYQILGRLSRNIREKLTDRIHGKVHRAIQIVVTFLLVDIGWIVFRSNSLDEMTVAFGKLLSDFTISLSGIHTMLSGFHAGYFTVLYMAVVIGTLSFLDSLPFRHKFSDKLLYIVMGWIIIGAWIFLQSSQIVSDFIYFQF